MSEFKNYSRDQLIGIINKFKKDKLELKKLLEQKKSAENIAKESYHKPDKKSPSSNHWGITDHTMRSIFNDLPIAVAFTSGEAKIDFFNTKFIQLFGYDINDISTMEIWWEKAYPDKDYREEVKNKWVDAAIEAHENNIEIQPQEWIVTAKDGRKLNCEFRMVPFGDRSIVVISDMTEERRKQQELQKTIIEAEANEKNLQIIIENSPLPMVIAVDNKYVTFVNKKFTELFGYTQQDIPDAETYYARAYPDAEYREMVYKKWFSAITIALETRKDVEPQEYILTTKSGEKRNVKFRTVILENKAIVVANDITQLRKQHNDLIIAKEKAEEASRLKTKFLNNISHEVRTPMNGIIGFSEMLNTPGISDEKRQYFSKIVQNSSHQLLKIIDDIIEISTLETKQKKIHEHQFSLNEMLMDLYSTFSIKSKESNISVLVKKAFHDDQSHIISDKTKLRKIVSNLLENALKFTLQGTVEFGYYLEKSNLILYIKDTGVGILAENHKIIFERFSQEETGMSRVFRGLGLGLSISKENAKLLGGDITLESDKDKGSTFYVSIPYKPYQAEYEKISENLSDDLLVNKEYTILIAEDEEVNYKYLEALFENMKRGCYNLIRAKNGKEAVDMCLKNKRIDLVLMDLKMPIMNGHDATKRIKSTFPYLPIIAQTAYSTESDMQLALEFGCDDFVSKPIKKEKLFELVNKYLKVKR